MVQELSNWFSSLSESAYQNSTILIQSRNQRIQKISREIYHLFNDFEEIQSGATFVQFHILLNKKIDILLRRISF